MNLKTEEGSVPAVPDVRMTVISAPAEPKVFDMKRFVSPAETERN